MQILTVNIGRPEPNPYQRSDTTGIGKRAAADRVEVRAPGPRRGGLGSGLVGDHIGDRTHHGGDDQAVYAYAREDLDNWADRLGRDLPNGSFGENLTTRGIDVNAVVLGEIWRVGGELELRVTVPRIPCATFRGFMGEPGWLKTFTADARPGSYFAVVTPGSVGAGDPITVCHRPAHGVTIATAFRAMTTDRPLLREVAAAGDDLSDELRARVAAYRP